MPHYKICPDKKNKSPALSESEVHWYFYVPKRERGGERRGEREREIERERERKRERVRRFYF